MAGNAIEVKTPRVFPHDHYDNHLVPIGMDGMPFTLILGDETEQKVILFSNEELLRAFCVGEFELSHICRVGCMAKILCFADSIDAGIVLDPIVGANGTINVTHVRWALPTIPEERS
jgi:hypothetical protein